MKVGTYRPIFLVLALMMLFPLYQVGFATAAVAPVQTLQSALSKSPSTTSTSSATPASFFALSPPDPIVNFTIAITPTAQTALQGQTITFAVTIQNQTTGWACPITLALSPLAPAYTWAESGGVYLSPAHGEGTFTSILTVHVASDATPGDYGVGVVATVGTATGCSASETNGAGAVVTVGPADFIVLLAPITLSIDQGSTGTFTITVSPSGGYNQPVTLSAVMPTVMCGSISCFGTTAPTPNPNNGIPIFTSSLSIPVSTLTPVGSYTITVYGTSGLQTASDIAVLTVVSSTFTLTPSPASVTIPIGQSGIVSIAVAPTGTFGRPVTLSDPDPLTGFSLFIGPKFGVPPFATSLTIVVGGSVAPGTYSTSVMGTDDQNRKAGTAVTIVVSATGFTLTPAPPSQTAKQGETISFTIAVAPVGTSSGAVYLAAAAPTGLTPNLVPRTGTPPFSAAMTVTIDPNARLGDYAIGLSGTIGTQVVGTSVIVTVTSSDYSITIAPPTNTASPNSIASYSVNVVTTGFSVSVSLSATGLPSGVTPQFSLSSGIPPFASTLTLAVGSNVPLGTYIFTVTGTTPSIPASPIVRSVTATLTITNGFSVAVSSPTLTLNQGETQPVTVTVTGVGTFAQIVTLASSAPNVFNDTLSITSGVPSPSYTSTLLISAGMNAATTTQYFITVTGTAGVESHQAVVTVTVTPSTFTLAIPPPPGSYHQNTPYTFTVTATVVGGFSSQIALSASAPSAFTVTFSPVYGVPTFASTMTIVIGLSVPDGIYAITIQGSGGSRLAQTSITLTVGSPPPLSVEIAPSTADIYQGGSSTYTVTVSTTGTLPVLVSLTSMSSTGFMVALGPTSSNTNYTSTMVVAVGSAVIPGPYVVTVQASGGGLTVQSTTIINVIQSTFTLSLAISTVTIYQGATTSTTGTVAKVGSFNQPITLQATADSSLSANVVPTTGTPPFTFTLLVGSTLSTPTNTFTVVVTGKTSSGNLTAQAALIVTVQRSTFTLAASPSTASIYQGQSATFTITATSVGTFALPITLSNSAPSATGLSVTVAPSSGTPTFTATLTVTTTISTPASTYTISVTGTDSGRTSSTSVSVTVTADDYSVTIGSSSASIYQTQTTTFDITIAGNPYWPGTINLAATASGSSSLPMSMPTTSGTPLAGSFTSTLTVSPDLGVTPGTYTITITATATTTGTAHSTAISLIVKAKPADYSVTLKTIHLSTGYTTIYVDGVDSGTQVNDATPGTFGPYDGLTSHTFNVQSEVDVDTTVKYTSSATAKTVTAASTLTFSYQKWVLITWVSASTFPDGYSITISVDGTSHASLSPVSFTTWQKTNKTMTFSLVSPKTITVSGKTWLFQRWINSAGAAVTSPLTPTIPDTYTAVWARNKFTITVTDKQGANVTLGTTVLPVTSTGVVSFTVAPGSYSLSTTNALGTGGTADVFVSWTIANQTAITNPTTLTVSTDDITVSVTRKEQVYLTLQSVYGAPTGMGWYDRGSTATFSVDSVQQTSTDTRYICTGYSGDATGSSNTGTTVMANPKTITFIWGIQYKLTINSPIGKINGDDWYNNATTASFAVTAPDDISTKYTFTGWSGDYTSQNLSGTLVMIGPKVVTANWRMQFLTTLIFKDVAGSTLITPPESAVITSPTGTDQTITSYDTLYLDAGTWIMKTVNYHGANVATMSQYPATPGGNWTVTLSVYTITMRVSSYIYGSASGTVVTTKFPDKTPLIKTADQSGIVTLEQLPAGEYDITVRTQFGSTTSHISLNQDTQMTPKVVTVTDTAILGVIGLGVVLALALQVRSMIHKRRSKTPKAPKQKTTSTPSPPEEGTITSEPQSSDDQLKL